MKPAAASIAEMNPRSLEFHALGPDAVTRNGVPVELGSRKQRAVLALLMMHANQVVSVDRILDDVWGDEGDGKTNALQVYVSRLRSALEPDRQRGDATMLERVGTGYRLVIDVERFDIWQFEDGVARGRALLETNPTQAAELLQRALALWTCPAYDAVADEEFARQERQRLDDARIDATEDRVDADLARGLAGELVSELETLRDNHPLRERLVGQQALALYRAGRPAAALRSIDRFRRFIGEELGIEPSPRLLRLEEQVLLHDDAIQPDDRSIALERPRGPATNPFRGLRPFGVDDAASFFGRDALLAELLRRLTSGQRLLALVGASGSGKSSLVAAGLVPALTKGVIDGSDGWLIAQMMPGSRPFAELEGALLRSTINGPDSLAEQFRDGDDGLLRSALRLLPDDDGHLVIVIDQFEELFNLVEDEAIRDRFLANLVTAVDDPHGRITVVLTLRADFYSQPLLHPEFGARLGNGIVNVTPLTAEELEAAAVRPAEQAGIAIEPSLLGQLISDVGFQPAALPLFQYTLTELFDRRTSDTLVASAYRSMGGLEGALQRRADELYDSFDPEQQEATRQLLLRLVLVHEDGGRNRRRVSARELASLGVSPVAMQHVIGAMGAHRLLSFDSDPLTGAPTVDLAHEALLTTWPTLGEWIEDSRDDLRRHNVLTMARREWELAGEHPDYLLVSARLSEFTAWGNDTGIALNDSERRFLDASAARAREDLTREERRRRADVAFRRRVGALVAVLMTSLGVAGLFLFGFLGGAPTATITFFGNRSDGSWNANLANGLDRAERELGIEVIDVPWAVSPGIELGELLATEPELVVTDGLGFAYEPDLAERFADIPIGVVDTVVAGPNVTSVLFANEEGAYLAGASAALKTETGIVGFVGGAPVPALLEFQAGFEAGALAVDPAVTVLATYVDVTGEVNGFASPVKGEARAAALFDRGADVIFGAAGNSGFGIFQATETISDRTGRSLWAIGVDNDQWFEVSGPQREHVLTSIIKRGDLAAFALVEHMTTGGQPGRLDRLGLADGAFDFSTQGNGLTPAMIATLDAIADDIAQGRIDIPTVPEGLYLVLNDDGTEVGDGPPPVAANGPVGVDGFRHGAPIDAGRYDVNALGTPVSLAVDGNWWVQVNEPGFTAFSSPGSRGAGDQDIVFLRPTILSDPSQPNASPSEQAVVPTADFDGWIDQLIDGVIVDGPTETEIGGRPAISFVAEVLDRQTCGTSGFCVGFAASSVDEQGNIVGVTFEWGSRYRVWWVDGGDEPPLVVVAATRSNDRAYEPTADDVLDTLVIGDPLPHPDVD